MQLSKDTFKVKKLDSRSEALRVPKQRVMERAVKSECTSRDLVLNLKSRTPKFKAGADLSKSVNLVDLDYNSEVHENYEVLELKLHLRSEDCGPGLPPMVK